MSRSRAKVVGLRAINGALHHELRHSELLVVQPLNVSKRRLLTSGILRNSTKFSRKVGRIIKEFISNSCWDICYRFIQVLHFHPRQLLNRCLKFSQHSFEPNLFPFVTSYRLFHHHYRHHWSPHISNKLFSPRIFYAVLIQSFGKVYYSSTIPVMVKIPILLVFSVVQ